jgi:Mg2+-importing ATPase
MNRVAVDDLAAVSALPPEQVAAHLATVAEGLADDEVAARRQTYGPNLVAHEAPPGALRELWRHAVNPLNGFLLALAATSAVLGDARSAIVIAAIVVLAIFTAFLQEHRSNLAVASLKAMVKTTAAVRRRGAAGAEVRNLPIEEIVPGDVVCLAAGDMIPVDLRLIEAKDLFVNQAALTGEAMPAEKFAHADDKPSDSPFDRANLCFMGANVVSGFGVGVTLRTGAHSAFGALAKELGGRHQDTAFDRGIGRFTAVMLRFLVVMVPAVFLINGLTKHDWLEALLFAVAVGVGLTPEMLPMIVTVNLAKGAIAMARAKVIVKRLNAIQNFGAMDVLCTDKTGTLTQDRVFLKRYLDIRGGEAERVLEYAYLNSHFQSGLRNLLDVAILEHVDLHKRLGIDAGYRKIDEVPFDFMRRRLSVVVEGPDRRHILICKGAVEEIFAVSTAYELDGTTGPLDRSHFETAQRETVELNEDGFRVIAVAYKTLDAAQATYTAADEKDLTLLGYIAFIDPPKDTARAAIESLAARGVTVKILTGDNAVITRKICREVGLDPGRILLGHDIDALDDTGLALACETGVVFAKLTPDQKERVIATLRRGGHVVGFLGDGINDSAALRTADVGISVDTAVDIARESADIILLEKSLLVLQDGVVEGRKVFANIVKYIRMGASSNFGNMFSVLGASALLPFLPMAPLQVLTNNLLYDLSQTAIPTDKVDPEYVATPRRWDIGGIFRFMVVLGPVSSIFDYATYGLMLFAFGAWDDAALFQTGWFVESVLSQTLIIHIIRTARRPLIESRASVALTATTTAICLLAMAIPYTWVGTTLGFKPLPPLYWPALLGLLVLYGLMAQAVKRWFIRRWGL